MIDGSIQKLTQLRGCTDEVAYLRQVKACIGAIGRIPNGALRGHVNRDDLTKSVAKLLTELDSRIGTISPTGAQEKPVNDNQLH